VKKILYVILDGAAGKACKTLGNKSSLEAAKTPFIDSLFHNSINGLMHVIGPNIAPQSDVAAFAMLGYSPFNVPARGVVEAIGAGLEYKEGEVALRCNIANVKKGRLVSVRLANLSKEQGLEIEKLINSIRLDIPFTFKHTVGYRGVLILHDQLSSNITNTHPGYIREYLGSELTSFARDVSKGMEVKDCKALTPDAIRTASLINDFTRKASKALKASPANYILTRDAGNSLVLFLHLRILEYWLRELLMY
jgi:2,3-bisphosphoglycerate-independent phosphoglycerate mutase